MGCTHVTPKLAGEWMDCYCGSGGVEGQPLAKQNMGPSHHNRPKAKARNKKDDIYSKTYGLIAPGVVVQHLLAVVNALYKVGVHKSVVTHPQYL